LGAVGEILRLEATYIIRVVKQNEQSGKTFQVWTVKVINETYFTMWMRRL